MANDVNRREFLKGAGLVLGGAATGVTGIGAFFAMQDAPGKTPRAKGRIVQAAPAESVCTGCGTCELVCAASHGNLVGPARRRLWLQRDGLSPLYTALTCSQCDYPACYYACPRRDKALCIDEKFHARYINAEACEPSCRQCLEACILEPSRINYDSENKTMIMCDLCKERTQGPACVEYCPSQCLHFEERA